MYKDIEIEKPDFIEISGIGEDGRILEINSDNKELLVQRAVIIANNYYRIAQQEYKELEKLDYERSAVVSSLYCLSIEIYLKAIAYDSFEDKTEYKYLWHDSKLIFEAIRGDYVNVIRKKYYKKYNIDISDDLEIIKLNFVKKRYDFENFFISSHLDIEKRIAEFFYEVANNKFVC